MVNNIRFMDYVIVVYCLGFFFFSNNVFYDFIVKFEVYCYKFYEDFIIVSIFKKFCKKINDLLGFVGCSVGKCFFGLVSY